MRYAYRSECRRHEIVAVGVAYPREVVVDGVVYDRVVPAPTGTVSHRIDPVTLARVPAVAEALAEATWSASTPDGVRALLLAQFDDIDDFVLDVQANLLRDMADYGGADIRRLEEEG